MASIGFICNKVFCLLQTTPTLRSWFSVDIVQSEDGDDDDSTCCLQQQPFSINQTSSPYAIKWSANDAVEHRPTLSEPTTPIRSSCGILPNNAISSWHRRRHYFEEMARGDSQPSLYYHHHGTVTSATRLPGEPTASTTSSTTPSPIIVYEALENVDDDSSPIKGQPSISMVTSDDAAVPRYIFVLSHQQCTHCSSLTTSTLDDELLLLSSELQLPSSSASEQCWSSSDLLLLNRSTLSTIVSGSTGKISLL